MEDFSMNDRDLYLRQIANVVFRSMEYILVELRYTYYKNSKPYNEEFDNLMFLLSIARKLELEIPAHLQFNIDSLLAA